MQFRPRPVSASQPTHGGSHGEFRFCTDCRQPAAAIARLLAPALEVMRRDYCPQSGTVHVTRLARTDSLSFAPRKNMISSKLFRGAKDDEPRGPGRQRPATVASAFEPCQRCHDRRDTSSCSAKTYVLQLTNRHNRLATGPLRVLGYVLRLINRHSLPICPIIYLEKGLGRCR
jgi:hypothetical protein